MQITVADHGDLVRYRPGAGRVAKARRHDRALAILLASDSARGLYAQRERLAELPAPPNPTPTPTPVAASTPQSPAHDQSRPNSAVPWTSTPSATPIPSPGSRPRPWRCPTG